MTSATMDTPSDWLTVLDAIDTSWNATVFRYSHLGRLPLELLEIIFQHIPRSQLPAVARINLQLREMAEKRLYARLTLLNTKTGWVAPEEQLWQLHCTLNRRPDLAQMVRKFFCTIYDQDVKIKVNTTSVFDGDEHFRAAAKLSLSHMAIGGRIFMAQIPNVEEVNMSLRLIRTKAESWAGTETCKYLARTPLSAGMLIPYFDNVTASSLQFPGLQQLTELQFAGSEFHWALAKLPRLRRLQLLRPCVILPEEAPNEFNTALKILYISARSDILKASSQHYVNLKSFLAHFPSLEDMEVTIYDLDVDVLLPPDPSDVQHEEDQSYNTLVEHLSPVADQLTRLWLIMYDAEDNYHNGASAFLNVVQPISSFLQFKRLTNLMVPYQCLLEKTTSFIDPHPSPAAMFPAALEYLTINCPQIYIYDWLLRLRRVRDHFPDLVDIELNCQLPLGDEWPVFVFENDEHPVFDVLRDDLDIQFNVTKREKDWKTEWEEYDTAVLAVIDWLDSLSEHGGMDRLLQ